MRTRPVQLVSGGGGSAAVPSALITFGVGATRTEGTAFTSRVSGKYKRNRGRLNGRAAQPGFLFLCRAVHRWEKLSSDTATVHERASFGLFARWLRREMAGFPGGGEGRWLARQGQVWLRQPSCA